jgi:hypothetical protein
MGRRMTPLRRDRPWLGSMAKLQAYITLVLTRPHPRIPPVPTPRRDG